MTLDGLPQQGGLLRAVLPDGSEVRAESDAQGRALLRLPLDRYVRIYPSLPRLGLEHAQIELLPRDAELDLSALSPRVLLQVGDPKGALPPGGEDDSDLSFGFDELQVGPENQDLLRVAFSAGAKVRGQVLDPEGRPVPDARVYLGGPSLLGAPPEGPLARSDAEGRFVLQLGASAALDPASVMAEAAGLSGAGELERAESSGTIAFEPLTLRLQPGEPLSGRVSDLAGRALQARVTASVGFVSEEVWTARCSPEGQFWFGAVAHKGHWVTVELRASCPGYASETVHVSRGPGQRAAVEIRLTPLARCRGQVLSARGVPVEGASVITVFDPAELANRYGPANGGPDLDALATDAHQTDAAGGFDFETRAGPRLLLVTAPGHAERLVATSLEEGPLRIRLLPASEIAGSIHTRGGEPLDYRLLILVPSGYEPPEDPYSPPPAKPLTPGPTRALPPAEVPTAVSATSTREGRFRFLNVPPGRFDVYARALVWGSFRPQLVARGVRAGQLDVRALFEPPPMARLRLAATRGGHPVTPGSCEFTVYDARGRQLISASPDEEGRLEFELWSFGSLLVEGRGFGLRSVQRRVEVQPDETQTLEAFDFDPRTGTVAILIKGAEAYNGVSVEGQDPITGRWVRAYSALSGDARLLSFPPGAVRLRVRGHGDEAILAEVSREVEVRLNETTRVEVDLSPGATGR